MLDYLFFKIFIEMMMEFIKLGHFVKDYVKFILNKNIFKNVLKKIKTNFDLNLIIISFIKSYKEKKKYFRFKYFLPISKYLKIIYNNLQVV